MGFFRKSEKKKRLADDQKQRNNETTMTVNTVAKDHHCPFCGYQITKDHILFVDTQSENYQDLRKYSFLKLCSSRWNLENMFVGYKTRGLYYRMQDVVEVKTTDGDWPLTVSVHPCDGRTPNELEEDEEWISELGLEDHYAQYQKKTSKPMQVSDDAAEEVKKTDSSLKTLAKKACPNCHCILHTAFGTIDTINVTMFGGTSSGKTAFLVALVQCLKTQLSSRHLGTATLLDTSNDYYQFLYSDCLSEMNGTAATVANERLFPFVFYYSNETGTKKSFISFYDIAGENTQDVDALLNNPGLQNAGTMLLMIDPNQLNYGAYFAMINGIADVTGSYNEPIDDYLSRAIEQHKQLGIMDNIRSVIVVMTKMDMPLSCEPDSFGMLAGNQDLYIKYPLQPNHHRGGVNRSILDAIGRELNTFIANKITNNEPDPDYSFLRTVENMFNDGRKREFCLLGVSTYTRVESGDPRSIAFQCNWDENSPKHRIIEPFLKILAQNKLVDYLD